MNYFTRNKNIVSTGKSWKEIYEEKQKKYNSFFWIPNLIADEFSEVIGGCKIKFIEEDNPIILNINKNNNLNDLIVKFVKKTCLVGSSAIFFFDINKNIYLNIAENIFKYTTIGDKLISITLITNIIKGTSPQLEILGFENNKIWKGKIESEKTLDNYNFLPINENNIKVIDNYKDFIPCVLWFWNCDKTNMFLNIPEKLFTLCNNILYQMNEDIFYSSSKLFISQITQINGKQPEEIQEKYKYSKVIPLDKPNLMGMNPYSYEVGDFQFNKLTNSLDYIMTLIRSMCRANKPLSASGTHNKHTTEVLMENINYYNNIIKQKNRLEKLLNDLFEKIFKKYSSTPFLGLTLEFNPIIKTQIEGIGNSLIKTNGKY